MSDKIEHLYWEEGFPKQEKRSKKGKKTRTANTKANTKAEYGLGASSSRVQQYSRFHIPECRHWRQRFDLEDGLHVFASAWFDKPQTSHSSKAEPSSQIDVGFYLDTRWASGSLVTSPGLNLPFGKKKRSTQIVIYPWEDWGVPENRELFRRALRWLLAEAGRGKTIEIGCMGGHGRTGTALACLLVVQGLSHSKATSKVWSRYCEEAIESRTQLDYIRSLRN